MKYLVGILLALGLSQATYAACSVGSGTYGLSAIGWGTDDNVNPNTKFAIAGVWTFSVGFANPHLKPALTGIVERSFVFNAGGSATPVISGSGTYKVDPATCSGTVTFPHTPTANEVETYQIFVTSPTVIYWVNTTKGIVLSGRMTRP
jgi:hypothetical protein